MSRLSEQIEPYFSLVNKLHTSVKCVNENQNNDKLITPTYNTNRCQPTSFIAKKPPQKGGVNMTDKISDYMT